MKFFTLFFAIQLIAADYPARFEGILGEPRENISNLIHNVQLFLPYNPIIVEVGGYEGEHTKHLSKGYPDGRVIVFEPNPRAFQRLLENTAELANVTAVNSALSTYEGMAKLYLNHGVYCNDPTLEKWSSLLEGFCLGTDRFNCFRGPTVEVPCVVLDDWCKSHEIDHIDFLQLDVEGFELQILKSSPEILKTIPVIHTKTNLSQFRRETTSFRQLWAFLEANEFTLLCHWYREGLQGEATFVQTKIYNAIFR